MSHSQEISREALSSRVGVLGLAAALVLTACGSASEGLDGHGAQQSAAIDTAPEENDMDGLREAFDTAVVARGAAYGDAEQRLVEAGEGARAILESGLDHLDPIGRLVSRTLLGRLAEEEPYTGTERVLDGLAQGSEGTVAGMPNPKMLAEALYWNYEGRSAQRAALLLVKGADRPRWKLESWLLYLGMCRDPTTNEGLLRFAVETEDEELRRISIDAIEQTDDSKLAARIEYERSRAELQGLQFPAEIELLVRTPEQR